MDTDCGFHGIGVRPPDIFEKLDAGKDFIRVGEELIEKAELFLGQAAAFLSPMNGQSVIAERRVPHCNTVV